MEERARGMVWSQEKVEQGHGGLREERHGEEEDAGWSWSKEKREVMLMWTKRWGCGRGWELPYGVEEATEVESVEREEGSGGRAWAPVGASQWAWAATKMEEKEVVLAGWEGSGPLGRSGSMTESMAMEGEDHDEGGGSRGVRQQAQSGVARSQEMGDGVATGLARWDGGGDGGGVSGGRGRKRWSQAVMFLGDPGVDLGIQLLYLL